MDFKVNIDEHFKKKFVFLQSYIDLELCKIEHKLKQNERKSLYNTNCLWFLLCV